MLITLSGPGSRLYTQAGGGGGGGSVYPDFPYDDTRDIEAGSLYVDPVNGNNSNNGLSQGNAKQTIAGAVSALGSSSSKIIYLMDGTHTMSAAINTTLDGTEETPIQLTSLPGHEPVIDINGVFRCFNLDGASWWRISHLTVNNWGGGGDDGAFMVGEDSNTSNITFFCIDGETAIDGDNNGIINIYGQRASNITIDRVRARFTAVGGGIHQNTAGIFIVRATGTGAIDIDHCEIDGFPIGIYHKHGEEGRTTLSGGTVSNTIITNCDRVTAGYNPAGWLYTNCVFGASTNGIQLAESDGGAAGDANQYVHCTFYAGITLRNQGNGANDNKLTNCVVNDSLVIEAGSITSDSDYNAFPSGNTIDGGNLAAWQSANSSDANSVQGTITFVGGADDSVASFYALDTGSIGLNAASDGEDMGADVTAIGVQAA